MARRRLNTRWKGHNLPTRKEYNDIRASSMPTQVVEYYYEDHDMGRKMSKEKGDSILGRNRMSIDEGM